MDVGPLPADSMQSDQRTDAFRILEHPSDLGIEATGRTLTRAFEESARGLISVILDVSQIQPRESREIALQGSDQAQLLVRWLSEILYLYDGQGFVCADFHIARLSKTALVGTVHGEPFVASKHRTYLDVKAITYHQLQIDEDELGALVRVYFDI
jgi:SHS2 domain-containing protein